MEDNENMIRKPFQATKLEEDREPKELRPFTVRLNKEERMWLDELKEDLNISSDGKALKLGAFIGRNVLQAQFTRPVLRYLFKKERKKLSDEKTF